MTIITAPAVDWSTYSRCSNCPARDGEPCTGREVRGSYATGDYRVHVGELSVPHPRMTLVERAEWRAALDRYISDTVSDVALATGATIAADPGCRFYVVMVGRWSAHLPICVCEIDGMTGRTGLCARLGAGDVAGGLSHGGPCDEGQGERPCHGWHTARMIALIERVRKPSELAAPSPGHRIAAPKAAKGDPTPDRIAEILAKYAA